MPPEERPRQDELLAMAYADGELRGADLETFQARLAREPALVREVSELRALEVLARSMAPPEPADYEWERLARDPAQRLGESLGWIAFVVSAVGLFALGVFWLATAPIPALPKVLCLAGLGGLLLLLLTTLRARLRVLPHDPYRKVQR